VAARDQHGDHDHHVPHGVRDPARGEQRDARLAVQVNELIAASEGASNRLIDVEDLTDRELEHLYKRFRSLARDAVLLQPGAKTTVDIETDERDEQDEDDPKPSRE
jgi:hypothetical protein